MHRHPNVKGESRPLQSHFGGPTLQGVDNSMAHQELVPFRFLVNSVTFISFYNCTSPPEHPRSGSADAFSSSKRLSQLLRPQTLLFTTVEDTDCHLG